MGKYYCEYCRSYLTHDSLSVRKSHLTGKNHIKYYCDYYESVQSNKESSLVESMNNEVICHWSMEDQYNGIPGKGIDESNTNGSTLLPPQASYSYPLPPPSPLYYNLQAEKGKFHFLVAKNTNSGFYNNFRHSKNF